MIHRVGRPCLILVFLLLVSAGSAAAWAGGPQIIDQLELEPGDGTMVIHLIDDQRGKLYLVAEGDDQASRLIRVDQANLTVDAVIDLETSEIRQAVIDTAGDYAYFATDGDISDHRNRSGRFQYRA
jgi:hypothetical protein